MLPTLKNRKNIELSIHIGNNAKYKQEIFMSDQVIHCPKCGKAVSLPENTGSKTVQCPICQHQFALVIAPAAKKRNPLLLIIIIAVVVFMLLVGTAILGILAAMLLPALSSARERAKQHQCLSNLKIYGTAIIMYANDSSDHLPKNKQQIQEYLYSTPEYTYCSSGDTKYVYLGSADMKISELTTHPAVPLLICWNNHPNGMVQVLYADGHVEKHDFRKNFNSVPDVAEAVFGKSYLKDKLLQKKLLENAREF